MARQSMWKRNLGVGKNLRTILQRPRNPERLAFAVQRLTGLGILGYLTAHIFVTGTVTSGREAWEGVMSFLSTPAADIGKLLLLVGVTFHGVNGIRVLLLELSPLVGRPARPDYPYKTRSLGKGQRTILYFAIVMAALSAIAGFIVFWGV